MAPWPSDRSLDGGIDEIPIPGSGRLWLAGKHAVAPDPEAALARSGADVVVCLNEAHELERRYPDYVPWLERHRPDRALWHPVPDLHAPGDDEARALLVELDARLDAGAGLLVHCGAGIGRAGTVAVLVLAGRGHSLEAALDTLRAHRPMAGPEAGPQHDLVRRLTA